MLENDNIKDLFQKGLKDHSSPVNPNLWSSISSSIGTTSATAATATMAIFTKIAITVGIAAAVTVSAILITNKEEKQSKGDKIENTTPSTALTSQNEDKSENELRNTEESELLNANSKSDKVDPNNPEERSLNVIQDKENEDKEVGVLSVRKDEPILNSTEEKIKTEQKQKLIEEEKKLVAKETVKNSSKCYEVKLINFFSPNNDGANDVFFLDSKGVEDFNIVILDQNYKSIFESRNTDFKWNGTYKDGITPVPEGSYIYILTAKDECGNDVRESHYVQLQRTRN